MSVVVFDKGSIPRTYKGLTNARPVRPIHTDSELRIALKIVDALSGRTDLTRAQQDFLGAWASMIEEYEQKRGMAVLAPLKPIEALKFLLDENGMSGSDLGRLLGSRQLGSAILRGERSLSKAHITALCKRFRVEPSLFLA